MKAGRFPDFLCIGAHKAGTTWLYGALRGCAGTGMPLRKEIHFFDLHREKGVEWYRHHFPETTELVTGDITPAYSVLDSKQVSEVRRLMPSVKIIFIMRDPIDRLWSNVQYDTQKGLLKETSPEAIAKYVNQPAILLRGNYPRTIDIWEQHYPAAQILYCFHDELVADPRLFLRRICGFLSLSVRWKPRWLLARRRNASRTLPFPAQLRLLFAERFHSDVQSLADRFGEYPSKWLTRIEDMLEQPKHHQGGL